MSNKKLTETEIKTALKHCANIHCLCGDCILFEPNDDECQCSKDLKLNALDLINRQKEEIERLKENLNIELENFATEYDNKIKSEARKEFAERAVERVEKAKQKYQRLCKEQGEEMEEAMHIHFNGIIKIINNLLKEMESEKDA